MNKAWIALANLHVVGIVCAYNFVIVRKTEKG